MKKIFLFVIVTVCCLHVTVFAQKSRVGIVAGLSTSNISGSKAGKDLEYEGRKGFNFGVIVDVPVCKGNFSIQPGLHYIQKGAVTVKSETELSYIAFRYAELQGNFIYNFNSDKTKGTYYLGAGPTFAIGLPSKTVIKNIKDNIKTESTLKWGNDVASHYKDVDYGINFTAGARTKGGFIFALNYTLGLPNILPGDPVRDEAKNRSFGIRFGWLVNNSTK